MVLMSQMVHPYILQKKKVLKNIVKVIQVILSDLK